MMDFGCVFWNSHALKVMGFLRRRKIYTNLHVLLHQGLSYSKNTFLGVAIALSHSALAYYKVGPKTSYKLGPIPLDKWPKINGFAWGEKPYLQGP